MKRPIPLLLAGLLCSGWATAEGLNFNQAVRAALTHSPLLERHYREWGVSGAGLAAGGVQQDGGDELPPPTFGGVLAWQSGDLAGVDAGRRASAEAFAKTLAGVKAAYVRAVAANQLAGVRRDALKAADAVLSLRDGQRQAGSASPDDWLKASQEQARARFELAEAQAEAQAAQQRFSAQAGLAPTELAEVLPALPGPLPQLAAVLAQQAQRDSELIDSRRERDKETRARPAFRPAAQRLPLTPPTRVTIASDRLAGESDIEHRVQLAEHQAELTETLSKARALAELEQAYRQQLLPGAQARSDETLKAYNGMLVSVYRLIETKREEFTVLEELIKARRELWLAWLALEAAGVPLARS